MRRLLLLAVAMGAAVDLSLADDSQFQVDPNKVSALADKRFDLKEADGFNSTAPGFDKAFSTGESDLIDRKANLGGRDIYAPMVDMSKAFPVPDGNPFTGTSSLSDKTSPLGGKMADLPTDGHMEHFDHLWDDKTYQGREEDLIRDAMDRLSQQSKTALAKQLGPQKGQPAETLSIDDVRKLINKDVAPAKPFDSSALPPVNPPTK